MRKNLVTFLILMSSFCFPQEWIQLGTDIDGQAGDRLGRSFSINNDGTIMAVSAPYGNYARVLQYQENAWTQLGGNIIGNQQDSDFGNSISINGDGTIVAIGARYNDQNGTDSGQVQVYQYDGSVWVQLGQNINGGDVGSQAGAFIDLSDDGLTLAVVKPAVTHSITGLVSIYRYQDSSWIQIGSDIVDQESSNQAHGVSLSNDGNIIAIGTADSASESSGTQNVGQVRVYQYNGTDWVQVGADIEGVTASGRLGSSVSLNADGNTFVAGAIGDGIGGSLQVFSYDGVSWQQVGETIPALAANDQFGTSCSINDAGTIVAGGAYGFFLGANSAGYTRVFEYKGESWEQLGATLTGDAAYDNFGVAVSLDAEGHRIAIGANLNDNNGNNSGLARAFELDCQLASPTAEGVDEICEGTSTTLAVTSENTINWYENEDSSEPLFTGAEFETPLLTETTSFWIEAENGSCISDRAEVVVTVIPAPEFTIETPEPAVCSGSEAQLFAVSEGNVIFWYANEEDEEYLYHGNLFITDELTQTTTYWVGAYNILTGCFSERVEVIVTVNPVPDAPIAVSYQTVEEGTTLADLEVDADGTLTWYANEALTVVLPDTTLVEENTIYYVTQTAAGCESQATEVSVGFLGLSDINGNSFTVYPNPTEGMVKIQSKTSVTTIEVFNISGQAVTSVKAANEVDISGYPSGTYILRITLENGEALTRKVIKK